MTLLGCFPQVVLGGNVVPVKDIPRLMTGDGHGHPLRNPRPDHVANGAPSKIMEQQSRYPDLRTCRIPGPPEIPAPIPVDAAWASGASEPPPSELFVGFLSL